MTSTVSSIPFLPSSTTDVKALKASAKARQTNLQSSLKYCNGYQVVDLDGAPVNSEEELATVVKAHEDQLAVSGCAGYDPNLTFKRSPLYSVEEDEEAYAKACAIVEESKQRGGQPDDLLIDRAALVFDAYFVEDVYESTEERTRNRPVKLVFFLRDKALQIVEKKSENSGLPQGILLKRRRVPLIAPEQSHRTTFVEEALAAQGNPVEFVTEKHLNVGQPLVAYGTTYHITACDAFTRDFLTAGGTIVPQNGPTPQDAYVKNRIDAHLLRSSHSGSVHGSGAVAAEERAKRAQLKQFLLNDRRVLRFYAVWDDTGSLYGELRPFVLHFFLVDSTVEIKEQLKPNSGRDAVGYFVKRQRLPRVMRGLDDLGSDDCVQETDLMIGQSINVFGRSMFLYDCDAYTRRYFVEEYHIPEAALKAVAPHPGGTEAYARTNPSINNVAAVHAKILSQHGTDASGEGCGFSVESIASLTAQVEATRRADAAAVAAADNAAAYQNAAGSDEQAGSGTAASIGLTDTVLSDEPRRRVDFVKALENDGKVLRFRAVFLEPSPDDAEREFIVSFYLSNDTMQVFEPPKRNSGFIGGKFLERTRTCPINPATGVSFKAMDFFVGAVIGVFQRQFLLTSADDFALLYMEHNCTDFPRSDINLVKASLAKALGSAPDASAVVAAIERCAVGPSATLIGAVQLVTALNSVLPRSSSVHPQDMITLVRHLGLEEDGGNVQTSKIFALFQDLCG